jgi:peptide chain release factor 2
MLQYEELMARLEGFRPALLELSAAFKPAELRSEIKDLDEKSNQPDFWSDTESAQKTLQRVKALRGKLSMYEGLELAVNEAYELCVMASEEEDDSFVEELTETINKIEKDLEACRISALLSGEYDDSNAIISFHAGAGGTEAQDWALMLFRMYTRWAERRGFACKVVDYLDGDEAGLKSAVILIEGPNAYGYLKSESGVHRLVRISPFDSSGRRHTSFAAIEVVPEISDDVQIEIRDEDLKVDTYRASGAGGQHVNKTESAIRITHLPTGIVVSCQVERSQHQNREVALRMLRSRLIEIKEREHLERIEDIKGEQKAIEWGSQIRSYVFMPYTLAKDHRTGFENGNINAVMDGDIDGFINAYLLSALEKTKN